MSTFEIKAHSLEMTNIRNQFEARWDFEMILAELRRSPVLEIIGTNEKVFALEYFATA